MTEVLVKVDDLTRYYQNHCAIRGLSFTLAAGEVLGFLGPNGAGKSTTMQIVTGNLAPSAGQVSIGGHDILDSPREAKALLGYLPDYPPLYRDQTVNEYLDYCARLHRVAGAEINSAVERVKARCGLEAVGLRLIGNLSKGFQQRVGIAQAIIHDPPVVILDEPTVGLDPIQIREIRALIRSLGSERSVILSTHILSEVQSTCDRVQIIRQGELVFNATTEALQQDADLPMQVALRHPVATAELAAIDGVAQAEALGEGRYRVWFTADADALLTVALARGWGLYELTPERQSLEDLFIELTRDDEAAA